MITKEKKSEILNKIKKVFKDSKSVVFVNFKGLTVGDASLLRRALRSESVGYSVAKKTLVRLALDDQKIEGERPALDGELALAYGEDSIAPARGVYEFQKKLEGKVSIMGGIFEGGYKSKEAMLEIASIPSLQVLRGMLVNLINSPIQRFAVALGQIAEKK